MNHPDLNQIRAWTEAGVKFEDIYQRLKTAGCVSQTGKPLKRGTAYHWYAIANGKKKPRRKYRRRASTIQPTQNVITQAAIVEAAIPLVLELYSMEHVSKEVKYLVAQHLLGLRE